VTNRTMFWTAWSNGKTGTSGAGYGFRISKIDRDMNFERGWESVWVELPFQEEAKAIEIPIVRDGAFWRTCSELRSKRIGEWLIAVGYATWPPGSPPKFKVSVTGKRHFKINREK